MEQSLPILIILFTKLLTTIIQPVPFTSNVVSSNPAQVRCTTLCDKDCQLLATGRWFSLGTAVSSTNEITEILLKVVLSTVSVTPIFELCLHLANVCGCVCIFMILVNNLVNKMMRIGRLCSITH